MDDIIETVNHFRCFDYLIKTVDESLTQEYIRKLHKILMTGTLASERQEEVLGDYKKYPNVVSDMETTHPDNVGQEIEKLLAGYETKNSRSFEDIIDFHACFEKIHLFYEVYRRRSNCKIWLRTEYILCQKR